MTESTRPSIEKTRIRVHRTTPSEQSGRDDAVVGDGVRFRVAEPFLMVEHEACGGEKCDHDQPEHGDLDVERASPFPEEKLALVGCGIVATQDFAQAFDLGEHGDFRAGSQIFIGSGGLEVERVTENVLVVEMEGSPLSVVGGLEVMNDNERTVPLSPPSPFTPVPRLSCGRQWG